MNRSLYRLLEAVDQSRTLQMAVISAILLVSGLPLFSVIDDMVQHDVVLYRTVASDLARGIMPYRDRVLEYPPYAIPVFALPYLAGEAHYAESFKLCAIIADTVVKCLLLGFGLRENKGIRSLIPLALYALAVPFMRYFYLQRYDVFPALISVASIWLFARGRYCWSGVTLAVGIGMKLYPAVFLPILLVLAVQRRKSRPFLVGLVAGIAPLVLSSLFAPWWRFMSYHAERGLQVESLYSSILWMTHHFGVTNPKWTGGHGCMELHGPAADALLPWAKLCFAGTVSISVFVACLAAKRSWQLSASGIARLLLLPLLGFVAFNQVLSPQYMIWLLPVAAMAGFKGIYVPLALSIAAMLTPTFYPVPDYMEGINFSETAGLVLRNTILVVAWCVLMLQTIRLAREAGKQQLIQPTGVL